MQKSALCGWDARWGNRRITKTLLVMKLTFVLLTAAFLNVCAKGVSQNVSFSGENIALEKIFVVIERQTGFGIIYTDNTLVGAKPVSIRARNMALSKFLDNVFRDQPLKYSIESKTITISRKMAPGLGSSDPYSLAGTSFSNAAPVMMDVNGRITDQNGNPLVGASVNLKGTKKGTITDANGYFVIQVPDGGGDLVISYVGYETIEVRATGAGHLNISLKQEDATTGNEVVVVGYGVQRKATLTGSVASIQGKELQRSPALNIINNLGGQLPGVITKMPSGEPGKDGAQILIRGRNTTGDNSPLVVVDGIPGVTGWERINPNDIESISVLKDASAAIYGARAANGVILITTKRGAYGDKSVISYSFNQAISQPTRIPKMASSAELAGYVNQLDEEAGQTPRYTDAEIELFRNGTDPNYINEDWYGKVLKKSSVQSQHNLNIRGGNEKVRYSVSGSYTNEGSIFRNGSHNFKTYSIRSNIDARLNKLLKVGFDLNGGLHDGNYPAFNVGTTFESMKQVPFIPVYWPNGSPSAGVEQGRNPAVMGTALTGNENLKKYSFLGKASFDLSLPFLIEGLGVDGYLAYGNDIGVDKIWRLPWTVYSYNKNTDTYIPQTGGAIVTPELTNAFRQSPMVLVNMRVKYELKRNDHQLNAFIAGEKSNTVYSNFSAMRKNYISSALDELFAGGLADQSTNGGRSESGRENLFGRVSYGFMQKYLLDFNFRYDGSSNFPKGKQFGFFPGVSVAWRLSQENFLKNADFIDNLKIRASIGQIGNDAVAAFQHLRLYTLGNTGMSFGQTPVATNGLVPGVSPNPNITWEVGTTRNIGLDGSLLNGLLGFTVDLFKQTRSNILSTRDLAVPVYTGLVLPNENIGIVENKGIEVELSHTKTIGDFSWRVAGNMSYARNKVIDISEAKNVPEWKKLEGHVLGAEQYFQAIGIFRTQDEVDKAAVYPGTKVGDLQYADRDGDGKITANDMYTANKTSTPEVMFGLNASFNYKNFSFWANFAGATRVWQYYHVNARVALNQLEDVIVNRYTPGSMDSKYPRLPTVQFGLTGEVDGLTSDFWLKDASYIRLRTLELGYTLPNHFLSALKIQTFRLYVNGQNLFTIDRVKWADPENTNRGANYYPQSKIFNIGANLSF